MYGKELNRRAMESLIKCGALDQLGYNRKELLTGYNAVLDDIEDKHKNNLEGQLNLFDTGPVAGSGPSYTLPRCEDYPPEVRLQMEKEVSGLYVSGHPLAQYRELTQKLGVTDIGEILTQEDSRLQDGSTVELLAIVSARKNKITKTGGTMAFVTMEDTTGAIEMLVFPKVFESYKHLLGENQVLYVQGRLSLREDEDPKLICQNLMLPQEAAQGGAQNAGQGAVPSREAAPSRNRKRLPRSWIFPLPAPSVTAFICGWPPATARNSARRSSICASLKGSSRCMCAFWTPAR